MIDVSDGLAQDLGHILNASKVGATLQLEQLPIDQSLKNIDLRQAWHYASQAVMIMNYVLQYHRKILKNCRDNN
jgi:thiamine monophosphate kinase